ncbi:MAG: hypothetical protein ACAI44_09030, partial [Candidatus Sericytochromatia bacterium]
MLTCLLLLAPSCRADAHSEASSSVESAAADDLAILLRAPLPTQLQARYDWRGMALNFLEDTYSFQYLQPQQQYRISGTRKLLPGRSNTSS